LKAFDFNVVSTEEWMSRRGLPWYELVGEKDLDFHKRLPEVKRWREQEYEAGRPSRLEDYFRSHSFCFTCKASGANLSPVDFDGETPLFEHCEVCGGTGKAAAS
jgi:hypothetical protein